MGVPRGGALGANGGRHPILPLPHRAGLGVFTGLSLFPSPPDNPAITNIAACPCCCSALPSHPIPSHPIPSHSAVADGHGWVFPDIKHAYAFPSRNPARPPHRPVPPPVAAQLCVAHWIRSKFSRCSRGSRCSRTQLSRAETPSPPPTGWLADWRAAGSELQDATSAAGMSPPRPAAALLLLWARTNTVRRPRWRDLLC